MSGSPRHPDSVADAERERLEAIRLRRTSPDRYIAFQMLGGRVILERIRRFMEPRGARVLEVGCGSGGILLHLASQGMRAHGIDRQQYDSPLPAGLDFARRHAIPARFHSADATRLPFRDASFDCVVASSVIEHLDDPRAALGEMARVLAPGGIALIDFPLFRGPYGGHIDDVVRWPWYHLRSERAIRARLMRRGAAFEYDVYRSLNKITHRAFRRMLPGTGFEVVEFGRIYHLTHPGRKLLVGLRDAMRRRSLRGALRSLRDAPREFTVADALAFPLLVALVPLSLIPGVDEVATTGVRYVLRRPA